MRTRNTTNLRNSGPVALENGSMKANIESYCKLLSLTSVMDNYETVAMDAVKTKISPDFRKSTTNTHNKL